jgi:hypothetical protein
MLTVLNHTSRRDFTKDCGELCKTFGEKKELQTLYLDVL